jgi:predicted secreted protein
MEQGAFLKISETTKMRILAEGDTLKLSDSSRIENNGTIIFENNSIIIENPGFPIYGSGHEIAYYDSTFNGWLHPGNLGLSFSLNDTISSGGIYRFHTDTLAQISVYNSIHRYFSSTVPLAGNSIQIQFHYDSTELNGLNKADLHLINISNQFRSLDSRDSSGVYLINGYNDSLHTVVLSPVNLNIISFSDSVLCRGDSLTYQFESEGIFNSGNNFNLYLANATDTILLNTEISEGTFTVNIPLGISSGSYQPLLVSSSVELSTESALQISINDNPQISFTPISSVCENSNSFLLDVASPSGGIYSGNGITNDYFDPSISGVGTYTILYTLNENSNCTTSDSTSIIVLESPQVVFGSVSPLCENDSIMILNTATPIGGIYSGDGVINDFFDPSVGAGTHTVFYTVTNTNNCVDSDSILIEVFPSPVIPQISLNINTLVSSSANNYQWYYEGIPIIGAIDSIYQAIDDGNYQVEVFNDNGCSEFSEPLSFIFNSIGNSSSNYPINIYPNPSNGIFYLSNPTGKMISSLRIISTEGKLVREFINPNEYLYDISELPVGYYLINTLTENGLQVTKMIIEK